VAHRYEGTEIETAEALPFWCGVDEVPYDRMWEDDRYWVPLLFNRQMFVGFFVVDAEAMQSMELKRLVLLC
jgi:8-oxo-dGTP diphosphatase